MTEAYTRVRRGDPHTSYKAAERIVAQLHKIQQQVYAEFKKVEPRGLTLWEIESRCGSHGSTFRTRCSELVQMGLLRDSGDTKVIPESGSDNERIIWVLTDDEYAVAAFADYLSRKQAEKLAKQQAGCLKTST